VSIRLLVAATASAAAVTALPATTPAHAAVSTLVGRGAWATPFGGRSSCSNVGTAGISCAHGYSSRDQVTGVDTCATATKVQAGGPTVTIVNPCHASLGGVTAGTGRAVGETAGACVTSGLLTGTVSFSDSTGTPYPSIPVTIVNDGGAATFFGAYVNAASVVVATTEGTFTMACGGPAGAFAGEYTLL
jgi:hypothetical protein